jgi:hypothetical protein
VRFASACCPSAWDWGAFPLNPATLWRPLPSHRRPGARGRPFVCACDCAGLSAGGRSRPRSSGHSTTSSGRGGCRRPPRGGGFAVCDGDRTQDPPRRLPCSRPRAVLAVLIAFVNFAGSLMVRSDSTARGNCRSGRHWARRGPANRETGDSSRAQALVVPRGHGRDHCWRILV